MENPTMVTKAALVALLAAFLVVAPTPAAADDDCGGAPCAVCVDECTSEPGWPDMCDQIGCDSQYPYCGQFGQCIVLSCNGDP